MIIKLVLFTLANSDSRPRGLLVLKNAPKYPFWPKITLFPPQLWIYLFNVSKILQNHATLSVKYELSIGCLSKVLI